MNPFMLHQTDECQHCATPVYWGEDTNIENVVKIIFLSNSANNLEADFSFYLTGHSEMKTPEQSDGGVFLHAFLLEQNWEHLLKLTCKQMLC